MHVRLSTEWFLRWKSRYILVEALFGKSPGRLNLWTSHWQFALTLLNLPLTLCSLWFFPFLSTRRQPEPKMSGAANHVNGIDNMDRIALLDAGAQYGKVIDIFTLYFIYMYHQGHRFSYRSKMGFMQSCPYFPHITSTRKHSSTMRTVRCSGHHGGRVSAPVHAGIHPPVNRILDTHLWKHYLPANTVADGKKVKGAAHKTLKARVNEPLDCV